MKKKNDFITLRPGTDLSIESPLETEERKMNEARLKRIVSEAIQDCVKKNKKRGD